MNLKPIRDQVVVKAIKPKDQVNGIFVPENAKGRSQEALVVAVGEGKVINGERILMEVKVGDHVWIEQWGGSNFELDGETYQIMKEEMILGVLEPS